MKKTDRLPSLERSPQALFCHLWLLAQQSTVRHLVDKPGAAFDAAAQKAVKEDSAETVFDLLWALLPEGETHEVAFIGAALRVMWHIDDAMYGVHPRAPSGTGMLAPPPKPAWVEELALFRLDAGVYHEVDGWRLIPRGPLKRSHRDEHAVAAESLAERFAALAVVPSKVSLKNREVDIRHFVVGYDSTHGVTPGSEIGKERIGFVPIAETGSDLRIAEKHRAEQGFLDYSLNSSVKAEGRLVKALEAMGAVDILMAPELVMHEDAADQIVSRLDASPAAQAHMIVAGSGHTRSQHEGQAWNETSVFNARGVRLWRQKKLWPASIPRSAAKEYQVKDCGPTERLLEDNALGTEIQVVDIACLGRCLVLICQDFTPQDMTTRLLDQVQPDWVFVPILDAGIDGGRWVHQKAFALSSETSARFLVCSSTSLGDLISKSPVHCGLAAGPIAAVDGQIGRQVKLWPVDAGTSPGHAVFEWHQVVWDRSTLSVEPGSGPSASP